MPLPPPHAPSHLLLSPHYCTPISARALLIHPSSTGGSQLPRALPSVRQSHTQYPARAAVRREGAVNESLPECHDAPHQREAQGFATYTQDNDCHVNLSTQASPQKQGQDKREELLPHAIREHRHRAPVSRPPAKVQDQSQSRRRNSRNPLRIHTPTKSGKTAGAQEPMRLHCAATRERAICSLRHPVMLAPLQPAPLPPSLSRRTRKV